MKDWTRIVSYAFSIAGVLAVVLHPGLFPFFRFPTSDAPGALTLLLTSAFVVGCLGGAFGLVKRRWWGFVGLYVATLIGTFGLALCMVPFAINAFSTPSRTVPLLALNSAFLIGLVLLQLTMLRQDRVGE